MIEAPNRGATLRESMLDILYLAHRVPYPPDKGDRIRNWNVLRWLSGRARVHLACLADEPVTPEVRAALKSQCECLAIVPVGGWRRWARTGRSLAMGRTASEGAFSTPELRLILDRWGRQTHFHAALASASSLVPYLRREALRDVPAVIDLVDVDSEKWLEYAAAGREPKAWLHRIEGARLRRLENSLGSWARAVVLVSEAEAELHRRVGGSGAIHAVVNGVDLDAFRPTAGDDDGSCVFVGALDYRPNVEGLAWFCRTAWPEVRSRRPGATLRLVGRKPTVEVCRLAAETLGVELVGQVPDVRPHMARASVVVAPLRIARGVQNKVLEALAMGKATVVSPGAQAGLAIEPGKNVLTAATAGEWADAILALLEEPNRRRSLGAEGRRFVESNHDWDSCLDPLAGLLGLPTGPGWPGRDPCRADGMPSPMAGLGVGP